MPVPGPRTTFGQTASSRNPEGELPDRFRSRPHLSIVDAGRSPGTMTRARRGQVLAPGQVRVLWRQTVNYLAAQNPFSWTANSPAPGRPAFVGGGFQITRALRYMARSLYLGAGSDNTRLSELHTVVTPRVRSKAVTIAAGSKRSQPTVRNRLTSFGSRVPPLNRRVAGGQSGDEG